MNEDEVRIKEIKSIKVYYLIKLYENMKWNINFPGRYVLGKTDPREFFFNPITREGNCQRITLLEKLWQVAWVFGKSPSQGPSDSEWFLISFVGKAG